MIFATENVIQGKQLQYLLVLALIPIVTYIGLIPRLRKVIQCHLERQRLRKISYKKAESINLMKSGDDGKITISGIFIHPVKSLRPVSVLSAKLNSLGVEGDRKLMLVRPLPRPMYRDLLPNEATHVFVTQRQCPTLATIVASLSEESLGKKTIKLSCGRDKVYVDTSKKAINKYKMRYRAKLWNDIVDVADVGEEAASFIQSKMKSVENNFDDVRVVSMIPHVSKRKTDERYSPDATLNPFSGSLPDVSLTDGFPLLVASEESLDELNCRLRAKKKTPLPMSRFRPNIVLKGISTAFEEDNWKAIQIGGPSGPILHIVKGCPRCKQSCTDQLTGKLGAEPLETLRDFRALGKNQDDVYFAQNALMAQPMFSTSTTINVGDSVTVLTTGNPVWDIDTVQAE